MELQSAKLTWKSDVRKGTSAHGDWQAQDIVVEYADKNGYVRKALISLMKEDFINLVAASPMGTLLNVGFDTDAREYNGRWYGSNRAWYLHAASNHTETATTATATIEAAPTQTAPKAAIQQVTEQIEELPF